MFFPILLFLACHYAVAEIAPCKIEQAQIALLSDESATVETLKLNVPLRKMMFCLTRDMRVLVNAGICPSLSTPPSQCARVVPGCEDIRWDYGMCLLLSTFVQWAANDVYMELDGHFTVLNFNVTTLSSLQRPVKLKIAEAPDLSKLYELPPVPTQPPGMLLQAYDTITFSGVVDPTLISLDPTIIPDCVHFESITSDYVAQKLLDSWYLPRVVCDYKRKLNYHSHRRILVDDVWKGGCYAPKYFVGNGTTPIENKLILNQIFTTEVWVMETGMSFGDTTRRCKKIGIATLFLSDSLPGSHTIVTAIHVAHSPGAFINWIQKTANGTTLYKHNIQPDYESSGLVHVSTALPAPHNSNHYDFSSVDFRNPRETLGVYWYSAGSTPNIMVVITDSAFARQSISTIRTRRSFKYTCSTVGGDSGSPLFHEADGSKVTLVAVHESRGFPLLDGCTALDAVL